jgi:hypothetical protein
MMGMGWFYRTHKPSPGIKSIVKMRSSVIFCPAQGLIRVQETSNGAVGYKRHNTDNEGFYKK